MIVNGFALLRNGIEITQWRAIPERIEHHENGVCVLRVDGATEVWENAQFRIAATSWSEPDPPPPPTNAEIYDQVIQGQKVVKALALALNDGTFVPGQNKTGPQLKAIITAKM